MLGITLLKTVDIRSYTFTDCHDSVLDFLAHNLEQNFVPDQDVDSAYRSECTQSGPDSIFGEPQWVVFKFGVTCSYFYSTLLKGARLG